MEKGKLREVIFDQQKIFENTSELIEREISLDSYLKGNEIVVISGVRRCGKSSLLKIISKKMKEKYVYINFDDIRFSDFAIENFQDIEDVVAEIHGVSVKIVYFLDEIQNIKLWEKWVNNLYTKKVKVFVTGSNSSLLSSEISTYLTGRNKVIKLFPFSFREFLLLKKIKKDYKTAEDRRLIYNAFNEYFEKGGFPLVLINDDIMLSKQYFEDVLNRDIIKRYNIKKIKEFNDLVLYLFSNISKTYSYSALKQISGIKSLSMINNYIEYLRRSFLSDTICKFDYSIKKQRVSSSKFYSMDNSFLKTIAFNFSENSGRRLENLVFIELKRIGMDVYYHLEKKECDFIIKEGLKIIEVVQVCLKLDSTDTKEREINGLIEAMNKFKLKEGLILTMDEERELNMDGKKILIKPVWKWLLENEN